MQLFLIIKIIFFMTNDVRDKKLLFKEEEV